LGPTIRKHSFVERYRSGVQCAEAYAVNRIRLCGHCWPGGSPRPAWRSRSRRRNELNPGKERSIAKESKKPNILVIFGDDIGMWNVGVYANGMMGNTPNIDRIGREGIIFTDHYGQASCTAGRAAFIMGQVPVRTGMTTIGIPGSTRGIQKEDPT